MRVLCLIALSFVWPACGSSVGGPPGGEGFIDGGGGPELCDDGIDGDRDGLVDEGCPCEGVATQDCYSGPAETMNVGTCSAGTQMCTVDAFWGTCEGEVLPESMETTCGDGRDEDCDGSLDCVDADCDGLACAGGGVCTDGRCCVETPETCNDVDDDCDGTIDEFPCEDCVQMLRHAGANRYATAVDLSKSLYPTAASAVVVIGSDAGEDDTNPDGALAGVLAVYVGGPVLLTQRTALTAVTSAEIDRLDPTVVYLIGGTGAIAAEVETAIEALGPTVMRISGANRAATAKNVALSLGGAKTDAIIVNGYGNLADAAAAAGVAARLGYPILFVDTDAIPSETSDALASLGVTKTWVVGGTSAVSAQTLGQLPSAERVSGATRYHTAAEVGSWAVGRGVDASTVALVRGDKTVDAMAASGAGTIHLFSTLSALEAPTESFLVAQKPALGHVMGGLGSFDEDFQAAFCAAVAD